MSSTPPKDGLPETLVRSPSASSSTARSIGTNAQNASKLPERDLQFWLVFLAICMSTLLSALDLTSVSTALPTIINELHGTDFVWVGSAYALSSTAFLPLSGGLAQIFGRRPIMLASLVFFAVGSAISGAAQSMGMLIAGRTVQGVGGGGILSLTEIIVADLVPLRERGSFMGIIGSVWAISSAVGPPIGGALASSGNWRWLFYLNLPLTGIAILLVTFFLNLRTPRTTLREKFAQMDWIGNFIVILSTTLSVVALSWAGTKYPWTSYKVLVPLVLGLTGLGLFLVYERYWANEPVVPFVLLSNRSSLSGYAATFLHGITSMALIYFAPVYFQAVKDASPIRSGVDIFGATFTVAPFAIINGISVLLLNRYRPQNYIGWILGTIGMGLMSTLKTDSSKGVNIGYQIVEGAGLGILFTSTTFPILASVKVTEAAHALAFFTFVRSFAQTWGIAIGSTILQNQLKQHLPADFVSLFPEGQAIAFSIIPQIPHLPQSLRNEVHVAFAQSLSVLWKTMIGISAVGFLSVLAMKELPMHTTTDDNFGFEEREHVSDVEKS